jgi:hypothetical protein
MPNILERPTGNKLIKLLHALRLPTTQLDPRPATTAPFVLLKSFICFYQGIIASLPRPYVGVSKNTSSMNLYAAKNKHKPQSLIQVDLDAPHPGVFVRKLPDWESRNSLFCST